MWCKLEITVPKVKQIIKFLFFGHFNLRRKRKQTAVTNITNTFRMVYSIRRFVCNIHIQKWRLQNITLSLFDSKNTASRFLGFLSIKFTMELQKNREIPFLDVCIKRDHNTFSPTVHLKSFHWSLHQVGLVYSQKV